MRVLFFVVAFLFASSAYAQKAETVVPACRAYLDGKQSADVATVYGAGMCVGVINTLLMSGEMFDKNKFCPPKDADPKAVLSTVVKYFEGNKERMKDDFKLVSLGLLKALYPCKT